MTRGDEGSKPVGSWRYVRPPGAGPRGAPRGRGRAHSVATSVTAALAGRAGQPVRPGPGAGAPTCRRAARQPKKSPHSAGSVAPSRAAPRGREAGRARAAGVRAALTHGPCSVGVAGGAECAPSADEPTSRGRQRHRPGKQRGPATTHRAGHHGYARRTVEAHPHRQSESRRSRHGSVARPRHGERSGLRVAAAPQAPHRVGPGPQAAHAHARARPAPDGPRGGQRPGESGAGFTVAPRLPRLWKPLPRGPRPPPAASPTPPQDARPRSGRVGQAAGATRPRDSCPGTPEPAIADATSGCPFLLSPQSLRSRGAAGGVAMSAPAANFMHLARSRAAAPARAAAAADEAR